MGTATVVVIEDDAAIAELVRASLVDEGFEVDVRHDGPSGLAAASGRRVHVAIVDVTLPGLDGFEVCRRLRPQRPDLLILMLSARSSELDRVLGLELGADDYLTKPFSLRELGARVRALLRRRTPEDVAATGALVVRGPLRIDVASRSVTLTGRPIALTRREFDLLWLLASWEGKVFSREELLAAVWGPGFEGIHHTVNSHINRLRAKLEVEPAQPRWVRTIWGRGYTLVAQS